MSEYMRAVLSVAKIKHFSDFSAEEASLSFGILPEALTPPLTVNPNIP